MLNQLEQKNTYSLQHTLLSRSQNVGEQNMKQSGTKSEDKAKFCVTASKTPPCESESKSENLSLSLHQTTTIKQHLRL